MDDQIPRDVSLVDILSSDWDNDRKGIFASPELTGYLTNITSLSLPDILQEPANLSSEASQLSNSLTSLCHSEYSTFLSLHRTSSLLSTVLDSFSQSLTSLLTSLPPLEAQSREFVTNTKEIQTERRKAALLLDQHDKIANVLEIPQLIDTCVRNGYYQEAMDLSAHARSLAKRFPDVEVIKDIEAEVEQAMRLMLAQLLCLLREPAKLPALFKAVNFLRRMDTFEELELALAFLTSRLVNLDSIIEGIEKDRIDHTRYVRRYVDAWREGVYDVVTQYTTIFLDRTTSTALNGELRYLLSTFTHHTLTRLRALLEERLPFVEDPASLTSLLTQLTYCATSFARIGLDFRSLLPPLFENAVKSNMFRSLDAATNTFLTALSDAQKYNRQPSQWLVVPTAATSVPEVSTNTQPAHVSPTVIASYPPLATYTNGILTTLNNLRLLAPVSLQHTLLGTLDDFLTKAASAFLVYAQVTADGSIKSRRASSEQKRLDQASAVCTAGRVFVEVLVPFVRRALAEGVYGVKRGESTMADELADNIQQWEIWLSSSDGH